MGSVQSRKNSWTFILFLIFSCISLVITLFPFFWMVSTSLKSGKEILADPGKIIPMNFSFEGFKALFRIADIPMHFVNSIVFALGLTIISLILNSMAAYAFAKISFPRRDKIFTLLVLTMMVPSQVTIIPVFLILKFFGFLNSYAGLIVPGCAHVFGIFMMRQFILDIPDELFEAARVDGCGEFKIFTSIVIPLCRPVIATLAVLSFVTAWNEFLLPLIIMQDESHYTLPVSLSVIGGQYGADWDILMAGAVLVALPSIIIFLFAQKHYIQGIAAGAGK
ncbi:MAG: carbohydrate ABC transporter permease [Candidatus Riflebacteria bacterium]|nr:carbohydrate ABC transporter permease [Candidatus Riflebacteria bacterium]